MPELKTCERCGELIGTSQSAVEPAFGFGWMHSVCYRHMREEMRVNQQIFEYEQEQRGFYGQA